MKRPIILAFETSCDETAVAVVRSGEKPELLASVVYSQIAEHAQTQGVVPEVASRAHVEKLDAITESALLQADIALDAIDVLAVTQAPGLTGSLLAGVTYAKTLARSLGKPIIPVNHLLGHIYSATIDGQTLVFPAVVLIVSGGHTSLVLARSMEDFTLLGMTEDDAAGEAFDKVARMLGLGHPGGPKIAALAKGYMPTVDTVVLPRPLIDSGNYQFSFSGLKTSVLYKWRDTVVKDDEACQQFAYAFQEAAIDVLVAKTMRATQEYEAGSVVLCGGVSANQQLRERLLHEASANGIICIVPSLKYCGDNAAMIAFAAEGILRHNNHDTNLFRDYVFPVLSNQMIF